MTKKPKLTNTPKKTVTTKMEDRSQNGFYAHNVQMPKLTYIPKLTNTLIITNMAQKKVLINTWNGKNFDQKMSQI